MDARQQDRKLSKIETGDDRDLAEVRVVLIVDVSQLAFQSLRQQPDDLFLLSGAKDMTSTIEFQDVDADQCCATLFQSLQVGDSRQFPHQEITGRQRCRPVRSVTAPRTNAIEIGQVSNDYEYAIAALWDADHLE